MDKNIQTAEGLIGFVKEAVQVVQVAHICFDQQGTPAQFLDAGSGFFCGRTVAKEVDHHVRTVAGQMDGDGASDPASGAGDKGSLTQEREGSVHWFSLAE